MGMDRERMAFGRRREKVRTPASSLSRREGRMKREVLGGQDEKRTRGRGTGPIFMYRQLVTKGGRRIFNSERVWNDGTIEIYGVL